jgi:hypothetical protein
MFDIDVGYDAEKIMKKEPKAIFLDIDVSGVESS